MMSGGVRWWGGLHVCTFKSTTLAVWELLCVCVFLFFFLEFVERPRQILSPRRTLGCWHVDKSSCLSQPCALIRSSTSKDWIMACCPRACRSLPCCRTAGDRQSALNLWVSGTRKKIRSGSCSQQETEGWCVYIDICTTEIHLYTYNSIYTVYGCSFNRSTDELSYMNCTCESTIKPVGFILLHFQHF